MGLSPDKPRPRRHRVVVLMDGKQRILALSRPGENNYAEYIGLIVSLSSMRRS